MPARVFLVGLLISNGFAVQAYAQQETTTEQIRPVGPIETVHKGFKFTEGPVWDSDGSLYFTDIRDKTIYKTTDGKLSTFTDESKTANGLVLTKDGHLLAAQMEGQIVAYDTKTKEETVVAGTFEGKRFNAPNDLVVDRLGGVYFTDPHFRAPDPWPQEILAVYYASADGKVTRVTDSLNVPNGVALSPDEKRLYVIPTGQAEMLVYDVLGPGKLANGRTLCTLKQPAAKQNRGGDGMTVDAKGNLYITSDIGVQMFSPEGKPLGLIEFPEQPSNVTFGGADRKTIYATARTGLYRVKMPIPGLPGN